MFRDVSGPFRSFKVTRESGYLRSFEVIWRIKGHSNSDFEVI